MYRYDMYMYGADFHAACVGEAALEALAQCASLACGVGGNGGGIATGLGELEPGLIHWADGASQHDGSGWTKVVATCTPNHDLKQLRRLHRVYIDPRQ
jgi:hypothetical protein